MASDNNSTGTAASNPRLNALGQSPDPAFVVSADGARLAWSNMAGRILVGETHADLWANALPVEHPLIRQVESFASQLAADAPPRLVRLRLPGAGRLGAITCRASHIEFDGSAAILLVALDARVKLPAAPVAPEAAPEPQPSPVAATEEPAAEEPVAEEPVISISQSVTLEVEAADGSKPTPEELAELQEELDLPLADQTQLHLGEHFEPAPEAGAQADAPPAVEPEVPAPVIARLPVRFVWQTDESGRFVLVNPDLRGSTGIEIEPLVGAELGDLAARMPAKESEQLVRWIGRRDTWSGVRVAWPVGRGFQVPLELAALPMFDRDRSFRGFRGFGVVREQPSPIEAQPAESEEAQELAVAPEISAPVPDPSAPAEPAPEAPAETTPSVVPLPPAQRPPMAPRDRSTFQEIARALGARMADEPPPATTAEASEPARPAEDTIASIEPAAAQDAGSSELSPEVPETTPAEPAAPEPATAELPVEPAAAPAPDLRALRLASAPDLDTVLAVLDALPGAVLVHRLGAPLFANQAFLDLSGDQDLSAIAHRGIDVLFESSEEDGLGIRTVDGRLVPVEAHLRTISWNGDPASLLQIKVTESAASVPEPVRSTGLEDRIEALEQRERELRSILDTATDGVLVLDAAGRIRSVNRSAEALFGYEAAELEGRSFTLVLAAESHRSALDYLDGLRANGVASVLNDGREVLGVVRRGGLIPLFMTMGRIGEAAEPKFCAVLRDITQFKKAEEELRAAKHQAERASHQKSDFLARVSHEVRTPLNAILGFAEVMMEERFGPVGTERYKEYLRDIHASGSHVISLVNDLLDLSKIEAGKLDLDFTGVNINEVVSSCVALLQPQANRNRIIIRTSLATRMPAVVADQRSLKQICLNLLSNAVKFTPAGGQVIVSTAITDLGQAVIRVRDTGNGMNDKEIQAALEPFRQLPSAAAGTPGTGLGLPLTKALVEANRATFAIQSAVGTGTLVEVIFPPTRVLAE